MADKNYGLLISALVAMVAIVGLVVLLSGGSTGAVTIIRGDTGGYEFPQQGDFLSGNMRERCWYDADGGVVCPQYAYTEDNSFGPSKKWREGGEPTVIDTASERGYWTS